MTRILLALPLAAALAGCGGNDGEGASVSIKGDGGNTIASVGKDGRVAIKAPGFEGSVKLPRVDLGAADFEIDGLKLYPKSTIANLNVESGSGKDGGVRVEFNSPAAAAQVRDWFRQQMRNAGFTVEMKDGALSGKTRDGSPFSLKIAPTGTDKSRGTLSVAKI